MLMAGRQRGATEEGPVRKLVEVLMMRSRLTEELPETTKLTPNAAWGDKASGRRP